MAAAGLVMVAYLLRFPRSPVPARAPADETAGFLRVAMLVFLVVHRAGIPTSWTRENITAEREAASEAGD